MTPEEQAALEADGDRYHRVNYEGIGTIADPAFVQMEIINAFSPIESFLDRMHDGIPVRKSEKSIRLTHRWT